MMWVDALTSIQVQIDDEIGLASVRLEHGKANEFGTLQLRELEWIVEAVAADPALRTLLIYSTKLTSRGRRIFVAGANVTERVGWTDEDVRAHVLWQRGILLRLRALGVFTVMLVDGLALGLGTELLLTADCRIATPHARFSLPETGLGIVPGALGTAELAAVVGPANALYLGMTGEMIDGETAARMGLVQRNIPDQEAGLALAKKMAQSVFRRSPRAVAAFKAAVQAGIGQELEVRVQLEREAYEGLVAGGDAAVGRASFSLIREGKTPPWPARGVPE